MERGDLHPADRRAATCHDHTSSLALQRRQLPGPSRARIEDKNLIIDVNEFDDGDQHGFESGGYVVEVVKASDAILALVPSGTTLFRGYLRSRGLGGHLYQGTCDVHEIWSRVSRWAVEPGEASRL